MSFKDRGKLTSKVQEVAKKHIGREISVRELRLIAYVQYVSVNEQKIYPERVNAEELDILMSWNRDGYCLIGREASFFQMSKKFWDFMCETIYVAYVGEAEAKPDKGQRWKISLKGIGRDKVRREIETTEEFGLPEVEIRAIEECEKHVMSRDTLLGEIEGKEGQGIYGFYAGGRKVGEVTIEQLK